MKRQPMSLDTKIELATKEEGFVRMCCKCKNLISTYKDHKMVLTETERNLVYERYENKLSHGLDSSCAKNYEVTK